MASSAVQRNQDPSRPRTAWGLLLSAHATASVFLRAGKWWLSCLGETNCLQRFCKVASTAARSQRRLGLTRPVPAVMKCTPGRKIPSARIRERVFLLTRRESCTSPVVAAKAMIQGEGK